jgi:3-oxoacyl-[acyl-carrier-protein] synthase II
MNTNIIGVGFLSPVGEGLTGIKYHYQNGHSNQEIKKFDPTAYLGKTGLKFVGNSTIMYCNLAYQCVESSGIKHFFEQYSDRIGLYDGSELANIEEALLFDLTAKIEGPDYVSPMKAPNTLANASASFMGIKSGVTGPNFSVSGGSAGFLQALELAELHLDMGIIDFAIVASVDAISIYQKTIYQGMCIEQDIEKLTSLGAGIMISSKHKVDELKLNSIGQVRANISGQMMTDEDQIDFIISMIKKLEIFDVDIAIHKIILSGLAVKKADSRMGIIKNAFPLIREIELISQKFDTADSTSGGIALLSEIAINPELDSDKNICILSFDPLGFAIAYLVTI